MDKALVESLRRQVQRNCDISDARHAGLFSICGLALRFRDLFKWQHGISPWQEQDSDAVLAWIDDRETHWSTLETADYRPIRIAQRTVDPFDTSAINTILGPQGVYYGAGFGYSLKPTFFLALLQSEAAVGAVTIVSLGKELARDLMALPALHQDGRVVLRQETGKAVLWDQIQYLRKSGRPPLGFALDKLGLPRAGGSFAPAHLEPVFEVYRRIQIDHELGELADPVFDTDLWRRLLQRYPHTPVELTARALKDLLADTGPDGTLHAVLRREDSAALGLYAAFLEGVRALLFPELRPAFDHFLTDGDWGGVRRAVASGYRNAVRWAGAMQQLFLDGRAASGSDALERELTAFCDALLNREGRPAKD
jgi:hypothetical protein